MHEYSLERMSEQIHHGKTKEYFEEVLSSYSNGNYRSAVVMLWSVVVCDLVYKLQSLIDLYEEPSARSILDEVATIQDKEKKSSAWELMLLDGVRARTSLLDTSEYENLRHIQLQRHLSAHPVLNHERELHSPNKETVRSLMRNALEGLLVKPPIYTQRIVDELLADIAETSHALNTREKLRKYIESRYLSRTSPKVELHMFKTLWKLVFRLDNPDCTRNRVVNLFALEVLSKRNKANVLKSIGGDVDYYSKIASKGIALQCLTYYLSRNMAVYNLLNGGAKIIVKHCVDHDDVGKAVGWFIKGDLHAHGADLVAWVSRRERLALNTGIFDAILDLDDSEEWQAKFCEILASYYSSSFNYDDADTKFQVSIPKYLSKFNRDSLVDLVKKINENGQCTARGGSTADHALIKDRIDEVFKGDFDYDAVPAFKRTLIFNSV